MTPADFPRWAWLVGGLCGIGVGLWLNSYWEHDSRAIEIFGLLLAAAGCLSVLIGVIRFVKWVWAA